jgi:ribonuclease P protein component
MKESLSPPERIRKKTDFSALYSRGRRYRGKYFSLIYVSNSLGFTRVGVVAGKKVGNAVVRNKAKRRMRELVRRNKTVFKVPVDIVIVAKQEMTDVSWRKLRDEFFYALEASGLKSS